MKIQIDTDERYPCYYIEEGCFGLVCNVNKRTVQRWKKTIAEYNKVQDEMEVAHDEAQK